MNDEYTNMTFEEFVRHFTQYSMQDSCCMTINTDDTDDTYTCFEIWHVHESCIGYLLSKVRVVGSFPFAGRE
jgi:hypothetical protein